MRFTFEIESQHGESVLVEVEVSGGWRGTYYDPPEPPDVDFAGATHRGITITEAQLDELCPGWEDDAIEQAVYLLQQGEDD